MEDLKSLRLVVREEESPREELDDVSILAISLDGRQGNDALDGDGVLANTDVIVETPITVSEQLLMDLVAGERVDAPIVCDLGHEQDPSLVDHLTATINEDIPRIQLSSVDIQVKCPNHPEVIAELTQVEVDDLDLQAGDLNLIAELKIVRQEMIDCYGREDMVRIGFAMFDPIVVQGVRRQEQFTVSRSIPDTVSLVIQKGWLPSVEFPLVVMSASLNTMAGLMNSIMSQSVESLSWSLFARWLKTCVSFIAMGFRMEHIKE
uniref:Uncharacterized protein n=1 Tax=Nelumbo nucifera TaxID=4432 RepID=A0A822XKG1_NELNU|nr:TPA_asm: hypothetical protein HUJ06_021666 [Nelumbo nucifera]